MLWRPARIAGLIRLSAIRRNATIAQHEPIYLRPYQETCLDTCIAALEAGHTRFGVSLPTGSGKTTVFISLLDRLIPKNEKATRSLIIVNSVELARQSASQIARLFPDWTVEIEQGVKQVASGLADVTVATYQSLSRKGRLEKYDPSLMKAIIVDEAHHAAARSYRAVLSKFHTDIKHPNPESIQEAEHKVPIIGFSATFGRHDGLALGSVFERIVYHRDFLEMIKEQWLCNVRFTTVAANLNLKDVTISGVNGDFNPTSLAQVVNTDAVNGLVIKAWMDRAADRKSTLVFCVNIDHVKSLTQAFRGFGVDARYLFSETPPAQRKALVEQFRKGEFPVLINCAILTEGADIPNIDCVLVARPTRSRNIFAQMIGRGMRLSPDTGKEDCRIIDFVDSNARVQGVASAPNLFGLDPSQLDCEDETPESLEMRAKVAKEMQHVENMARVLVPDPKAIMYTDHEDPFGLVDADGEVRHIYTMSPLSWVACGDDIYVLELLRQGFIRVEPSDENKTAYVARYTASWVNEEENFHRYSRSQTILEVPKLHDAIRGADTFVMGMVFRQQNPSGILRSAAWRKTEASDAQKKVIKKRWAKTNSGIGKEEEQRLLGKLTKGEAANLITRFKHGSQGRLKRMALRMQKVARDMANEEARRNREHVEVGPLPN